MQLYTPINTLKPVAEHLWIADGPIVTMRYGGVSLPFPTRMVVARLSDGGLWIWSPTEPEPALVDAVRALGPVRHLVSPNCIHYAHIPAWKALFPDAIAWSSPGVEARARSQQIEVRFDAALGEAPDPAWAAEIDQVMVHGSRLLTEVVFFHRASRTAILADLIENFERDKISAGFYALTRLGGVADPDGQTPRDLRLTFLGHTDEARAAVERVLAWAPERVIIAHGRWYPSDGLAELRRGLRWVGATG